MAPPILPSPKLSISASPLTPSSFQPFGNAICSPLPSTLTRAPPVTSIQSLANTNSSTISDLPTPTLANQSTALKYSPISVFQNNYDQCESARSRDRGGAGSPILERHPYTTQTFVPLGVTMPADKRGQGRESRRSTDTSNNGDIDDNSNNGMTPSFLVIVAPSLHGQRVRATVVNARGLKEEVVIRDPPDMRNMKAFVAHGGQAVTYGAGTWHAPMVVVGRHRVDFVVVQFVNGVAEDDCQEVAFEEGIVVDVDIDVDVREMEVYEDEVAKL
ncbi:hypothetical protein ACO22_00309 [Paracoccidioides brasiliensis]|uniref:Ureidoglycolate hydrolase n=1 Tax=Paracoccidioides brasiliensis TaxID=121759 RepID=A0A1D2JPQ1_PARBR|nr:hypothetical protein ACO22_00309 [Paracoccidioides brasiliensis]